MKEKYIKPKMSVEEFETADIITSSGVDNEPDTDIPWGS